MAKKSMLERKMGPKMGLIAFAGGLIKPERSI
jgi:hypothetical protein